MLFVEIMQNGRKPCTQCRQAPASRLRTSARVPSADAVRGSMSQLIVLFQGRAFECCKLSETELHGRRSSRVLMFWDLEHPALDVKQKTRFLFVVVGCGEAGDGRDAPSPSGSSQPGPSARCPMALPKPMIVFAFVQARGRALLLASLLSLAAVAFCCAYTLVRPSSFAETFLVSSATFMRVLVRAGWRCACRAADAGSIRLVIIQLVIQVGHA